MKLGIIIYSNDAETVWNAFRLGSTTLAYDNEVKIFLLGKGVESADIKSVKFNIKEQMATFLEHGGELMGCSLCCEIREDEMPLLRDNLQCDLGSMQDIYALVNECDKVMTF